MTPREKALREAAAVADDHVKTWGPAMASPAIVIRDAILALIDQPAPEVGVRVKPLEWRAVHGEYVETYQAKCAFGFYRVFEDEDSAAGAIWIEFAVHEDRFCTVDAMQIDRIYGEFYDAKAAAQADLETRVLSALEPGDGWRDIASAPRDGTPVDVYLPDFNRVAAAWFCEETGLWPREGDLAWSEDGEPTNVGLPSHWRPRPAPPRPREGDAE